MPLSTVTYRTALWSPSRTYPHALQTKFREELVQQFNTATNRVLVKLGFLVLSEEVGLQFLTQLLGQTGEDHITT